MVAADELWNEKEGFSLGGLFYKVGQYVFTQEFMNIVYRNQVSS